MIILRKNDITRSTLPLPHFLRFNDHRGEHMTGRMPALSHVRSWYPDHVLRWTLTLPSFTAQSIVLLRNRRWP